MNRLKEKKENMSLQMNKKILIFVLIFLLFQGLIIVDNEYSAMMAEDNQMFFGVRRMNEDWIKIVLFGEEKTLNVGETLDTINNSLHKATNRTSIYLYKAKISLLKFIKKDKKHTNGINKV